MGMRIVFMGSPEFAVASLEALVNSDQEIVGVVTAPDRPQGRGKKVGVSAVKAFALLNELKVLQPDNLKEESFIKELLSLEADLQIIVAFRMLPEVIWSMPKRGTFNLHASLLPHYRGASPVQQSLLNGDEFTGITAMLMEEGLDSGPILGYRYFKIPSTMLLPELMNRLSDDACTLTIEIIHNFVSDL